MKNLDTGQLLCIYFGLDNIRSIKRRKVLDELVKRGISVAYTEYVLRDLMRVIGWAADNRIPEIDNNQGEEEDNA
jgi:hypothetical protein